MKLVLKLLVPAAIVSLLAISSASAQPTAAIVDGLKQSAATGIIQVEERRDRDRQRFTPGRRYKNAPPGWNRHGDRRPGDWRTRGCIMVGPIWFCP